VRARSTTVLAGVVTGSLPKAVTWSADNVAVCNRIPALAWPPPEDLSVYVPSNSYGVNRMPTIGHDEVR
jgi:hypothetical protein